MRKIVLVVPSLQPSGWARQICQLATGFVHEPEVHLAVLVIGESSVWVQYLRQNGVLVDVVGRRYSNRFDLRRLLELRGLIHSAGRDVIHAWTMPTARLLVALGVRPSRLIVSPVSPMTAITNRRLGFVDLWLLRRARTVVAIDAVESAGYRSLGVRAERLMILPPGVESKVSADSLARLTSSTSLTCANTTLCNFDEKKRTVLLPGPWGGIRALRVALYAFDILAYLYPEWRLVLLDPNLDFNGKSTKERQVAIQLAHSLQIEERVQFVAGQELGLWLNQADLVWVPAIHGTVCGRWTILQALASACPIVASDLPEFAELLGQGRYGVLTAPGNAFALAQKTRQLIEDSSRARQIAEAGRDSVGARYPLQRVLQRARRLYWEDSTHRDVEFRDRGIHQNVA